MAPFKVAPEPTCYPGCTGNFLHKPGVPEATVSCRHHGPGVHLAHGDLLQRSSQHCNRKKKKTEGKRVGRKGTGASSAHWSPCCSAATAF